MRTRCRWAVLGSGLALLGGFGAACSETSSTAEPALVPPITTSSSTTPPTSAPPTTAAPTTAAPTTAAPTTAAPTPTTVPAIADLVEAEQIGTSVRGRPITAVRRGTGEGIPVVIIGVIHGNEAAGVAILERLEQLPVPDGVDLWLVDSINPDGQHDNRRTNANLVDLNRNFPHEWAPLQEPGKGQYAGPGAASEPETQAAVAFIERIRPALVIWYHQDLYRIAPGTGRAGEIRSRYAELTGLPVATITGGIYTGTAASWARNAVTDTVSFIVELGPTLSASEADTHAEAVLTIATEL